MDEKTKTEYPLIRVEIFTDRMVTQKLVSVSENGNGATYSQHEESLPLDRSDRP